MAYARWNDANGNPNLADVAYTIRSNAFTDEQVALPSFVRDMPGDYMHPRYGFTNQWLKFVQERRASAAQAPLDSSGPGPNIGGPDVAIFFTHIFIEGGYHSWLHMNSCTTSSDDCTSSFNGKPAGSPDTTGGSSNLGTNAECIRNCFCQWSIATSANVNSTYDHAF